MKKEIVYQTFVPGGNDTAFVFGTNYTSDEKKKINDGIMQENSNIEQVGFLGNTDSPELVMAGGEFCGNATRSAVYYYLNGKEGSMTLKVNQKDLIEAGVKDGKAWCEIPLKKEGKIVEQISHGIHKVYMEGMTTIVIQEKQAAEYLKNRENLKETAMNMIEEYKLLDSEAVGVMFLESVDNILKINPIVWVNSINTLFYETACGSGTTATAIVKSYIEAKTQSIDILQPSGYIIKAIITVDEGKILKAIISGDVLTDDKTKKIFI